MSKFKPGQAPHNKSHTYESNKMVKALSAMGGYATGLNELPIHELLNSPENLEYWAKTARTIARSLNKFAKKLKKGIDDAAERTEHQGSQSHGGEPGGSPDCPASPVAGTLGALGEEARP